MDNRAAAAPEPGRARWFAGMHLALAGLFVLALGWFELSGVDLGYHIAYGREMFRTGRIVEVDSFIYGASGHRFVNANWLSQAVFAALFDRWDSPALFALRLLLIAVLFAAVASALRRMGVGAVGVAMAWIAVALGSYERFTLRPELFSYALLAVQLALLARGAAHRRVCIGIAATQVLWVNLHSYFLLGPILTGCLFAGACVTSMMARARRPGATAPADPAPPTASSDTAGAPAAWALLLALQCAACLLNPRLVEGALFPIRTVSYLRGEKIMAQDPLDPVASPWGVLSEFQSPFGFFRFLGASRTTYAYAALLALAAAGVAAAALRRRWGALLAILALTAVSTQMRRNIAPFAVVAAPLAIAMLGDCMRGRRAPHESAAAGARSAGSTRLLNARSLAVLVSSAALIWWLAGIWTGRFYYVERRPARRLASGFCPEVFPLEAVRWINSRPQLRPRAFADLMTCSNVLPWLRPDMRMYITTNTFAYPAELLMTAWNLGLGRTDADAFLDEHGVNVVLLRAHEPTRALIRKLAADARWALVYVDPVYVVFIRRMAEHAAIIRADERRPEQLDPAAWIAAAPRPHAVTGFRLTIMAASPFSLGWFDQARPMLEEAVRLEPDLFEAWNNLGICRLEQGKKRLASRDEEFALRDFRAARGCFENALRLDPSNREARFNLDHTPVAIEGRSDRPP